MSPKKTFLLILVQILFVVGATRSLAQSEHTSIYSRYPEPAMQTAAPSGYRPAHVMAYFRHGSRYFTSASEYGQLLPILEGRDVLGVLTPEGKSLLQDVRKIVADADGNYGAINPQGVAELKGIMSRLGRNCSQVFSGRNAMVDVIISNRPRCLVSMSYGLDEITRINPGVQYSRSCASWTQERFFSIPLLRNIQTNYLSTVPGSKDVDCDPAPFINTLFTDGGASLAPELQRSLPSEIWKMACAAESAGYLGVDIFKYFPEGSMDVLWLAENRRNYFNCGPSAEFCELVRDQMKPLLKTFIDSADSALEGNGPCATFFYGHDSGVMSLAVLLGIKGCSEAAEDSNHPESSWMDSSVSPMSANIQMIIYTKKGSPALVKLLLNEREMMLDGLSPVSGPYYRWSDVRGRYLDEIENGPSFTRNGWQEYAVREGVKYMRYSGYDAVSRSNQLAYVVDVDMNNPRYQVEFSYGDRISTSDARKKAGALATINATYEKESVFIKVDGDVKHNIESLTVPIQDLIPVPQWKTDCAICTDGRKVEISYAGKDLTLEQQREAYAALPWDNVFTGAPMLIDNYVPVGKYFVAPNYTAEELNALRYEEPTRHQGVRHPRCAAAVTADNHLILIAVDGRRPDLAEGMSCWEFTSFIEKHFHPSYAINLDGGGSTALSIEGFGDTVVNYPSKGRDFMHGTERKVPTHIHIIDTEKE